MLEKRDVIYYRKLAYAQGGLGIAMLFFCFVAGVAARYHTVMTHLYMPYWIAIPLVIQGALTWYAAKIGKRWPLGIWIPFFVILICGICILIIALPPYKVAYWRRFPCIVQTHLETGDSRCYCATDDDNYLKINGAKTIDPCMRAINIMNIMSNANLLLAIVAMVPELLMFVMVCNDLCCLSCRRAALVPQVLVAGGPQQPSHYVPVQQETVTFRTDQQPGSSSGQQPSDQAGPLPQKPKNPGDVPHAF